MELDTRYLNLLRKIVTVDRLRKATGLEVVDSETMAPFTGRPEGALVWLVVQSETERAALAPRQTVISEQVRRLLTEFGYPSEAATTVVVTIASKEQIKAHGGPRGFYR